jgi:amino acid permease
MDGLCHSAAGIVPLSYSFTALGWGVLLFVAFIPALVAYWLVRMLTRASNSNNAA